MKTWRTRAQRINASEEERAQVCARCNCRKGEHPADDEPGLGPASKCEGFFQMSWEDVSDRWSAAINESHPARSGSHEEYGIAMEMISNRHSKQALIDLVNFLLVQLKQAGKPVL